MRSVTHNTLFLTGASIIQKALSFVFFAFLARTFSSSEIGAYSYALAFTTLFAIIVDGGLSPVLIRHTARHPEQMHALLMKVLKLKILLLIVGAAAMTVTLLINDAAFEVRHLILTAAAVMLFDSLNLSIYGALRGTQNLMYESIGMIAAQTTSLTITIVAVLNHMPIVTAIVALGVGSVVNAVVAWYGLRRTNLQQKLVVELSTRALTHEAVPFALAGAFARGYSYLDLLLIGSLTSFAAAGTYSVANKLTFVFQFIPLALSAALYPAFSKLLRDDQNEVAALWKQAQRYLLFVSGIILLVLITLRAEVLGFFGRDHVAATTTLILLSVALVFAFLSYPVGALLNAAGLQKYQTGAMACTLAVNAVMNVILIPRFGAEGAAFSALVGNIVLFSVGAWFAHHKIFALPWNSLTRFALLFAVGGVIGSVAIVAARSLIKEMFVGGVIIQISYIGILALIGVAAYMLVMIVTGGISKSEIVAFVSRMKK